MKKQAERIRFFAEILIEELNRLDVKVITHSRNHFDTVTINAKESGFSSSDYVLSEFHKYGINLRKVDDDLVSIAFNETTLLIDLDEIIEIFADMKGKSTQTGEYMSDSYYDDKHYQGLPQSL